MRFRLTPATGEIWLHTISGREYVVVGAAFNTVTDEIDVLYRPAAPGDWDFALYCRQLAGHPKAWYSTINDGRPRFQCVRGAS